MIVNTAMWAAVILSSGFVRAQDDQEPDPSDAPIVKQLRSINLHDASEFSIYRDAGLREMLELREEPISVWTNVLRRQYGSVFVWTWHGRPEVIGSIFSYPAQIKGKRAISHEFHTLSTKVLVPRRDSPNQWIPKAGLERKPVPDAPNPAENARLRLIQMRDLARNFSARSVDLERKNWELRLQTQPIFRYQSIDPEIIDGALFSYVTSAGTDPEVILLIEASKTGASAVFEYAVCRFSNHDLYASYRDNEVWSSVIGGENTQNNDPQHRYRLYQDRRIDEVTPEATSQ